MPVYTPFCPRRMMMLFWPDSETDTQLIIEEQKYQSFINSGLKIINKHSYIYTIVLSVLTVTCCFYVILYYLHLFCHNSMLLLSLFWPPNNKPQFSSTADRHYCLKFHQNWLSDLRDVWSKFALSLVTLVLRLFTILVLWTLHWLPIRQQVIFKTTVLVPTRYLADLSALTASTDGCPQSRSVVSEILLVSWTRTSTGQRS